MSESREKESERTVGNDEDAKIKGDDGNSIKFKNTF